MSHFAFSPGAGGAHVPYYAIKRSVISSYPDPLPRG